MPGPANATLTELYGEMWDESPLAVIIGRDDRVVYLNPPAGELLQSNVVGQPLQRVLTEVESEKLYGSEPKAVQWRAANGDSVFVLQVSVPDERLRETLQHSAEMSSILASIADAVYVGDMDGIYLCNRPALEMLGFDSPEELKNSVGTLAARIQTRVPETGELLGADEQPFACALRGEQTIKEVLVHHLKTDRDVLIRCAAAPVYLDGRVIAAVAVNTDITEARSMERKLRETESLAAVGRLAWKVAHEVNNPLQAATNLVSLAASERTMAQERNRYLADVQVQLRRIADVLLKLVGPAGGK